MKKNILFVGALLCATVFSGCTVTSEVTTYGLFESTIKEVTQDLEKEGFNLVESNKDVSHNPGIVRGKLDKFNGEERTETPLNLNSIVYSPMESRHSPFFMGEYMRVSARREILQGRFSLL